MWKLQNSSDIFVAVFIVLEMGTGFCNTYEQFLAVRALFGIAMGGLCK